LDEPLKEHLKLAGGIGEAKILAQDASMDNTMGSYWHLWAESAKVAFRTYITE